MANIVNNIFYSASYNSYSIGGLKFVSGVGEFDLDKDLQDQIVQTISDEGNISNFRILTFNRILTDGDIKGKDERSHSPNEDTLRGLLYTVADIIMERGDNAGDDEYATTCISAMRALEIQFYSLLGVGLPDILYSRNLINKKIKELEL